MLSPGAMWLRFLLVMICIAAIELGRKEGLACAVALLWHGQCSQLLALERVRQHVLAPDRVRIRDGWLDVDWRLRGAIHHQLRLVTTAGLALAVYYLDPWAGVMALVACHLLTESVGVVMARIIDPLVQVEAERRVSEIQGLRPSDGSDRGDFRNRN